MDRVITLCCYVVGEFIILDRVITLCCYVVGELIIWNRVIILCCYTAGNYSSGLDIGWGYYPMRL